MTITSFMPTSVTRREVERTMLLVVSTAITSPCSTLPCGFDFEMPYIAVQEPTSDQSTSRGAMAMARVFSKTMLSVGPATAAAKNSAFSSSSCRVTRPRCTASRTAAALVASNRSYSAMIVRAANIEMPEAQ